MRSYGFLPAWRVAILSVPPRKSHQNTQNTCLFQHPSTISQCNTPMEAPQVSRAIARTEKLHFMQPWWATSSTRLLLNLLTTSHTSTCDLALELFKLVELHQIMLISTSYDWGSTRGSLGNNRILLQDYIESHWFMTAEQIPRVVLTRQGRLKTSKRELGRGIWPWSHRVQQTATYSGPHNPQALRQDSVCKHPSPDTLRYRRV